MNSQLNSQATNWGIDYSQNRAGQIYGNAISNLGQQTGNVIMEFAKKQRDEAEKKQKREAVKMMLVKNGMTEADAEKMSKGINVDEVLKAQQIDNDKKQMEAQMKAAEARVIQAQTEAAQERAKTEAATRDANATRSVLMGGSAPGTPPPMLARNGTPAADMSAMGYMRRMAEAGATPDTIREMGGAIKNAMPDPDRAKIGKPIDLPGGRKAVWTSGGGIQVLDDKKESDRGLKIGDTETRDINGVPTVVEWQGSRNGWVRKSDQQPLTIPTSPFDFTGAPRQNPAVWGTTPTASRAPASSRYKIIETK